MFADRGKALNQHLAYPFFVFEHQFDWKRMRLRRKIGNVTVADKPRHVLFRRYQYQAFGICPPA